MSALPQIPEGLSTGARMLWLWLQMGGSLANVSAAAQALHADRKSIRRWAAEVGNLGLQTPGGGAPGTGESGESGAPGTTPPSSLPPKERKEPKERNYPPLSTPPGEQASAPSLPLEAQARTAAEDLHRATVSAIRVAFVELLAESGIFGVRPADTHLHALAEKVAERAAADGEPAPDLGARLVRGWWAEKRAKSPANRIRFWWLADEENPWRYLEGEARGEEARLEAEYDRLNEAYIDAASYGRDEQAAKLLRQRDLVQRRLARFFRAEVA